MKQKITLEDLEHQYRGFIQHIPEIRKQLYANWLDHPETSSAFAASQRLS